MRIFQCIHKYSDHIPQFEARWKIDETSNFSDILSCIIKDGYASVYQLHPSERHAKDTVFFTIWNYDRMQLAWARENNCYVTNLDEIRLAQIEAFKPDVVYDMSPFVSEAFIGSLKARFNGIVVAWNSFPKLDADPSTAGYDAFVSNYRPFVEYWHGEGSRALELQPGIPPNWIAHDNTPFEDRRYELIHYGQIGGHHKRRAKLVHDVSLKSEHARVDFRMFGNVSIQYRLRKLRRAFQMIGLKPPETAVWPSQQVRKIVSPPLFGANLYEAIRDARVVMNTYIDASTTFHSNMRIFETIGNGTLLAAPRGGVYPEGLEEGRDLLVFDTPEDLISLMEDVRKEPKQFAELAASAKARMGENFSKTRQYETFRDFIASL